MDPPTLSPPPARISAPTYGALITVIYALYSRAHFLGLSPTSHPLPWSSPPRVLLLHEALLPQVLLFVALLIPLDRKFIAAVFLPLIGASCWLLLGTSSSSPAIGYAIGTYISLVAMRSLELLVFRNVHNMRRAGEPYPAHSARRRLIWTLDLLHNLRGINWSFCVPLPAYTPTSHPWWLATRVLRGMGIYLYLDLLANYMHHVDRAFFLPSTLHPLLKYPAPHGFPEPTGALKIPYLLLLSVLRTTLAASAIWGAIDGLYTLFAVLFVSLPLRGSWCRPASWPPVFGPRLLAPSVREWWARSWHGLFRNVFTAPAGGGAVVGFVLSSALHFCGSWTQARTGWWAVVFFTLQPVALAVERCGGSGRGGWGYGLTFVWLAVTALGFFEEYRWGGLWSVEPVPVSVVGALAGRRWDVWSGGEWWRWASAEEAGEWGRWMGEWGIVII